MSDTSSRKAKSVVNLYVEKADEWAELLKDFFNKKR